MKQYLLTKKTLNPSTNGIYNYCPFCMQKWKAQNKDTSASYKDTLKPLVYTKYLVLDGKDKQGNDIKYIDEYWHCVRCDRKIIPDDFVNAYCVKSDGKRYTEQGNDDERIDAI